MTVIKNSKTKIYHPLSRRTITHILYQTIFKNSSDLEKVNQKQSTSKYSPNYYLEDIFISNFCIFYTVIMFFHTMMTISDFFISPMTFYDIKGILIPVVRLQILVKPAIEGGAEAPLFYASKKPELILRLVCKCNNKTCYNCTS